MARGINSRVARRRRENAFREQGGLCWYCKQPMVIRVLADKEKPPADTCTLEHLRPRGSPDRRPGDYKANVAACHACNQREGQKHAAELQARGWKGTSGGFTCSPASLTSDTSPPTQLIATST